MNLLFSPRPALLLACALAPAALLSGGCGGAGDGSRPANFKTNDPVISGNLGFSDVSAGALIDATPLLNINSFQNATLTTTRAGGATSQKLNFAVEANRDVIISRLAVSLDSRVGGGALAPFGAGERLSFPRAGSNIEFTQRDETGLDKRFRASGGAIVVERADAGGAQLRLDNLRFEPTDDARLGAFSLSGTLSARQVSAVG